jgi:hypothetical protein
MVQKQANPVRLQVEKAAKDRVRMVVRGRLDADHCAAMWEDAFLVMERVGCDAFAIVAVAKKRWMER